MTDQVETPAQRLRRRRLALNLSQEQLGVALGRARETINRYETGAEAVPRWVWPALDGLERDRAPAPAASV